MDKEIKVVRTGCFGLCEMGPVVIVYPEGAFYARVKEENVEEIVQEHLVKGRIVQHLLHHESSGEEVEVSLNEIEFYKKQKRVALRNCGVIDPEKIEEYIAFDGYRALAKALTEMTQQEVIDEILKSGLRGRGGAGFPTGRKWQFTHDAVGDKKYVACNADEGDPGAFMDRSVLELSLIHIFLSRWIRTNADALPTIDATLFDNRSFAFSHADGFGRATLDAVGASFALVPIQRDRMAVVFGSRH